MISKELVAASTEPLILSLLSRGESYGYALIQDVKRLSGEALQWTDGMLYPVLHRMEQEGLIQSQWRESDAGRKRKYYSIKKQGRQTLDQQREQWKTVSTVLTRLWKERYV
jgi:DNA-binding PadR family transcriptional regulator